MTDVLDSITQNNLDKLQDNMDEWREEMTSWEAGFCEDMVDKYDTYGPLTQMSAKQCNRVTEIVSKYEV